MDEKDLLADSITKALAYTENGGKLDISNPVAGKTGEMKSIFQFLPATWKSYSNEVYGKDVPMDADSETYVVKSKVRKWIDEGKTAGQIASMWNAGEGRPNAYKENWVGYHTNPDGSKVKYDTPAYAKKVIDYSKKFYEEKKSRVGQGGQSLQTQQTSNNGLLGKTTRGLNIEGLGKSASQDNGAIKNLMSLMKGVKNR